MHKYVVSGEEQQSSKSGRLHWAMVACPGSTFAAPSKKQKTNDVSPFSSAPANPHKICPGAKKLHVVTFQIQKLESELGIFGHYAPFPGSYQLSSGGAT